MRPIVQVWLGLALALALAAMLAGWQHRLRARTAALAAEQRTLETSLAAVSQQRLEAEPARAALAALLERRVRLAEDRDAPRWSTALGSVATAAGVDVELQDIRARGTRDDQGACELRIDAVCTGREPRTRADRFRRELEALFVRHLRRGEGTTRFERLEDEAPFASAHADRRSAKFTIVVTTDAQEQPELERSAGR